MRKPLIDRNQPALNKANGAQGAVKTRNYFGIRQPPLGFFTGNLDTQKTRCSLIYAGFGHRQRLSFGQYRLARRGRGQFGSFNRCHSANPPGLQIGLSLQRFLAQRNLFARGRHLVLRQNNRRRRFALSGLGICEIGRIARQCIPCIGGINNRQNLAFCNLAPVDKIIGKLYHLTRHCRSYLKRATAFHIAKGNEHRAHGGRVARHNIDRKNPLFIL